ncbi:MAG: hypothetical protein RR642_05855 [Solibacillus sp.]
MKRIQFIEDGFEIVVDIPIIYSKFEFYVVEGEAYYKDFELYRILVIASSEQKVVELATKELLTNHPFEKVVLNY